MSIRDIENGEPDVEKFKFRAYFTGTNTWEKRVELMQIWRQVCGHLADYNASVSVLFLMSSFANNQLMAATKIDT